MKSKTVFIIIIILLIVTFGAIAYLLFLNKEDNIEKTNSSTELAPLENGGFSKNKNTITEEKNVNNTIKTDNKIDNTLTNVVDNSVNNTIKIDTNLKVKESYDISVLKQNMLDNKTDIISKTEDESYETFFVTFDIDNDEKVEGFFLNTKEKNIIIYKEIDNDLKEVSSIEYEYDLPTFYILKNNETEVEELYVSGVLACGDSGTYLIQKIEKENDSFALTTICQQSDSAIEENNQYISQNTYSVNGAECSYEEYTSFYQSFKEDHTIIRSSNNSEF